MLVVSPRQKAVCALYPAKVHYTSRPFQPTIQLIDCAQMENTDRPSEITPDLSASPSPLEGLQFQRAEISGKACVACSAAIPDEYFHLNGVDLCPGCAGQWQHFQQEPKGGALLRGVLYGFGAAIAGAILMAVISYVTGYQLALISIAVGWMVGKAFRTGTGGGTSKRCQLLAVTLAYFGITMSFIPDLFGGPDASKQITTQGAVKSGNKDGKSAESSSSDAAKTPKEPMTAGRFALGLAALIGVTLLSPFLLLLTGFSGLINLAIVFFGLQQAWKLMAPDPRTLDGPLTQPAPAVPATI